MSLSQQQKVVSYEPLQSGRQNKPLGASMYPDKISPAKDKKVIEISI